MKSFVFLGLIVISFTVNANQNEFSLGYAISKIRDTNKSMQGMSVQYGYKFPSGGTLGVKTVSTYTESDKDKLFSAGVGPLYEFTDEVNGYGILGPSIGSSALTRSDRRSYGLVTGIGVSILSPASLTYGLYYEVNKIKNIYVSNMTITIGYDF